MRSLTPVAAFQKRYTNRSMTILDLYNSDFNTFLGLPVPKDAVLPELDLKNPKINVLLYSFDALQDATITFLVNNRPDSVPIFQLQNFVEAVVKEYRFVPYHNFAHGISVMQFFYAFVQSLPDPSVVFDKTHLFVALIAALAHDIGHPAKNNAYNIAKKTPLAFKALNKSVLEKHHIKKLLYLLKQPETNLFQGFTADESSRATQLIIDTILATDMADHFNLLERFVKTPLSDFGCNNNFLTGIIVHACDIGNSCLDFPDYISWAKLVVQEFQTQTECEKRNCLKESEFMKFKGRETFVKDQISFASNLIRHICIAVV